MTKGKMGYYPEGNISNLLVAEKSVCYVSTFKEDMRHTIEMKNDEGYSLDENETVENGDMVILTFNKMLIS